jgi:23S rRNA pseudouridine2605 synthase|tara:strand:+ start:5511 stop:6278 length:768 start_codon:yes stop_codon:yes gene_type:complete
MKGTNPHTSKTTSIDKETVRLNKFISNAGVCSRRAADNLILEGRIKVNNNVVRELGLKINTTDKVQFDNKIITSEKKLYILVNKPRNVICTKSDEKGRKSIMDLLPERFQHLYPVGRLDRNTTGVILLTNDGALTQNLLHPSKKINKVYKVKAEKQLTQDQMNKMVLGLELEDGLSKFNKLSELNEDEFFRYGIEIHSGKNRVIRRMFEAVDNRVLKLDRVMFHTFEKRGIPIGSYREITQGELKNLGVYLKTKR